MKAYTATGEVFEMEGLWAIVERDLNGPDAYGKARLVYRDGGHSLGQDLECSCSVAAAALMEALNAKNHEDCAEQDDLEALLERVIALERAVFSWKAVPDGQ